MVLQKEDIWERLKTESKWIPEQSQTRTPFWGTIATPVDVPERQFRFIVGIWISGTMGATTCIQLEKYEEDGTFTMKFSPIPVAPADFRQIPKGSLSITDPILTLEGGTNLYGNVDLAGVSINVTVEYWDWDI